MATILTLRFVGENMHPQTVPAKDLAALLLAAEKVVIASIRQAYPDFDAESVVIGVSKLEDASLGICLDSSATEAVAAMDTLTGLIDEGQFDRLNSSAIEGIKTIARFSSQNKAELQIWKGPSTGSPRVRLQHDFISLIPDRQYIRGETVFFGLLDRVGGVDPRARIKMANGMSLTFNVSEEMARQLGNCLYKEIAVNGRATWDPRTMAVEYFRVEGFSQTHFPNATTAFEELREATSGALDHIKDIEKWCESVRNGEISS